MLIDEAELKLALGHLSQTPALERFVVDVCNRTTGLGADGVVVWRLDPDGQLFAGIWNSDGSRAGTCGNALRCLAAAVLSRGHWNGLSSLPVCDLRLDSQQTETQPTVFATLLNSAATNEAEGLYESAVGMGEVLEHRNLSVSALSEAAFVGGTVAQEVLLSALEHAAFVRLANPHLVLVLKAGFFRRLTKEHFAELGKLLQTKTLCNELQIPLSNIGFVGLPENTNAKSLDAIVYERGAGLTQCCGSGGCAMQVTLEKLNDPSAGAVGSFAMPGGVISVINRSGSLQLHGPAQQICRLTVS